MLAIIMTATGIALVLTVWLYGSYQVRKQFFLGFAEHELFDVIQGYYQDNEAEIQKDSQTQRIGRVDRFAKSLHSKYPNVPEDSVKQLFESQGFWRRGANPERSNKADSTNASGKGNNRFVSSFVFRNINWGQETVDTLSIRFKQALLEKGITTGFKLNLLKLPEQGDRNDKFYKIRFKNNQTRPMLVDPTEQLHLEIDFENPWLYILKTIAWQLFISIVLIGLLIGTFFYLWDTIKKQNQLARLRKAFVNNMTHELKTPISTVMAAVESIQRFGARDDKEKMNRYLTISRQELEHLSDMIERVLQVDVAETNGVKLEKSTFDLVELIQESIENTKLFAKRPIEIQFFSEENSYRLFADPSHIKNVISNLLDNAVKYSKEQVDISIDLKTSKHGVSLSISDKGIGIPKLYQKGVFDLFFRVPSGNIHDVKGFGLGLAYVKQIIQQHQGTIELISEEGVGSTFVIYLPNEQQ